MTDKLQTLGVGGTLAKTATLGRAAKLGDSIAADTPLDERPSAAVPPPIVISDSLGVSATTGAQTLSPSSAPTDPGGGDGDAAGSAPGTPGDPGDAGPGPGSDSDGGSDSGDF